MGEEKSPLSNPEPTLRSYVQVPPPSYEESAPPEYGPNPPPKYGPDPIPSYEQPLPTIYGQRSSQVIVTHVTPLVLGPEPATVTCPSCYGKVTTSLEVESSSKTHLIALLLFIVFFPLTCVPYFIDSCKSKNHYCPNCGAYLGRYEH